MASGRLRALLRVQQEHATRNTTAQKSLLHVAPVGRRNTQHLDADPTACLRRHIEAVARAQPMYWTAADIEEAVAVGMTDYDNAVVTFRTLAAQYGSVTH